MNIRMYNVDFGDCFLLQDETEDLLIDFGSDNHNSGKLQMISDDITANRQEKFLSVLMTHYHKDHINGFYESDFTSKNSIKNIYMPDIFRISYVKGELNFFELHIISDIFEFIILKRESRKIEDTTVSLEITLFNLLRSLSRWDGTICFKKRGDTFFISDKEYEVLWPCFDDLSIHYRVIDKVNDLLEHIGFGKKDEGRSLLNGYMSRLFESYRSLVTSEGIMNADIGLDFATDDPSYIDIMKIAANTADKISNKLLNDLKSAVDSMRRQSNKISLVFQDKPVYGDSRILMTGDVPKTYFDKIILNNGISGSGFQTSLKYSIIKAPHHGTENYFTPLLPPCRIILASNGDPAPLNSNRWSQISKMYGPFCARGNSTMSCTNRRCELLNMPNVAACINCPNSNPSFTDFSI